MIRHIPRSLAFASVLTFFGASGYFACGDDTTSNNVPRNDGSTNRDGPTTGDGTVTGDRGPDGVSDGDAGNTDRSADAASEEA